ncbi:MAG: hypothetical protein K0B10_12725 [Vicingaceae bacterium]|nr:hypothetical protein [Vicingaceae bacterium]
MAIIAFLFTAPFHYAYIAIEKDGGIVQALSMTLIIIGAIIAIVLFNSDSEEAHH